MMSARVAPAAGAKGDRSNLGYSPLQGLVARILRIFSTNRSNEANLAETGLNEEEIEELRMVSTCATYRNCNV
jgi:hypothetical protein